MANWFEVDKEGLSKQAKERGPAFILVELIANALDERPSGVTHVVVKVDPLPNRPYATVMVEDNSERGYGNQFNDAWTLFAESYKRNNPTQSGQFNLGCKLWLSLCQTASIETTTGTVVFDDGGRHVYPRRKRERGTVVKGIMYLKRDDLVALEQLMNALLLPDEVVVEFNGQVLQSREPLHSFEAVLPTQKPDDEGVMRPTSRKTTVSVYEVRDGEQATLYELGIPVVESPCNWHVNIGQKVPLNKDRDNVTPAYSRKVKTHVANNMRDDLTAEDGCWARDVFADPDAAPETINKILDETEGKNRVVYDPSDPEANVRGAAEGYTVIPGNRYSKDQWQGIRNAGGIAPAGQKFPTPKPYSDDPNADPALLIPESKWTPAMRNVAEFAKWLAIEGLCVRLTVNFVEEFNDNVVACYSRNGGNRGTLDWNMKVINRSYGNQWFNRLQESFNCSENQSPLEVIVHELSHHLVKSHFNKEPNGCDGLYPGIRYFYDATGRVGVLLAGLVLRNPEKFQQFLSERK